METLGFCQKRLWMEQENTLIDKKWGIVEVLLLRWFQKIDDDDFDWKMNKYITSQRIRACIENKAQVIWLKSMIKSNSYKDLWNGLDYSSEVWDWWSD